MVNELSSSPSPFKVSIALCTYNGAAFLQKQLDSIAAQSLLPFELVVCDDQSSDETMPILKAFQATAPFPVHLYSNEIRLRSTRNFEKALRLCKGDYLALCDQDDVWRNNKIERLATCLHQRPDAMGIFSDGYIVNHESVRTGKRLWDEFKFSPAKQTMFCDNPLRIIARQDVVTGCTAIFQRSILERFDHIPTSWVHDGWLTWAAALAGGMLFSTEALIEYRTHATQQLGTADRSVQARLKRIRVGERQRYIDLSRRYADLLPMVKKLRPNDAALAGLIEGKVVLLSKRSQLPDGLLQRILKIFILLPKYFRFANGWHSVCRDFFLGPKKLTSLSVGDH